MPTPPRRHWFQFGLRTMFVVVTVAAVPLGWLAWEAKVVRERRSVIKGIYANYGRVYTSPDGDAQLPWLRRAMGDVLPGRIILRYEVTPEERARVESLFPEAEIQLLDPIETWNSSSTNESPPPQS